MARPKKYPDELVARGVRLALESGRPIAHVAGREPTDVADLRGDRERQHPPDPGTVSSNGT